MLRWCSQQVLVCGVSAVSSFFPDYTKGAGFRCCLETLLGLPDTLPLYPSRVRHAKHFAEGCDIIYLISEMLLRQKKRITVRLKHLAF